MHSPDSSSNITFPESGSHLLSQSSPELYSNTGPGGDDLSISELSLSDRPFQQRPFSLLARPLEEPSTPTRDDGDDVPLDKDSDGDGGPGQDAEKAKRVAARLREEKLQSDLFILKKLNASFALFNDALGKTESANECIAARLEQTDALLTKYVGMLSKSEQTARLILDEKWLGAENDEAVLRQEREEAEKKARREAEERVRAAQKVKEQLEREEKERAEREQKERIEREKKENAAARGGVRGVRGTRASMRGSRTSTTRTSAGSAPSQPGSSSTTQTAPGVRKSASGRPSGLPTRAVRGS